MPPSRNRQGSRRPVAPTAEKDSRQRLSDQRMQLTAQMEAIAASGSPDAQGQIDAATQEGGADSNILFDMLSLIDKPRAALFAAGKQGGNALGNLVFDGPDDRVGWDEFKKDVGRNIGMGDIIEEETQDFAGTDADGQDMNIWAKRGLGFAGDVALDPLTYLAPNAKLAKLGKGGLTGLADNAARAEVNAATRGELRRIAAKVRAPGAGASRLTDDELKLLEQGGKKAGLVKAEESLAGGFYLNKPGTGAVVGRARRRLSGGTKGQLKQVPLGRPKLGSKIAEGLGQTGEALRVGSIGSKVSNVFVDPKKADLLSELRSGDTTRVLNAHNTLAGGDAADLRAAAFANKAQQTADQLIRDGRKAGLNGSTINRALEGAPEALAEAEQVALGFIKKVQQANTELIGFYNKQSGSEKLIEQPNYSFKRVTEEIQDELSIGARPAGSSTPTGKVGLEGKANVKAGETPFGEVLRPASPEAAAELKAATGIDLAPHPKGHELYGLTPREQFEVYAKEAYGDDYKRVFDDDFYTGVQGWVRGATSGVRRNAFLDELLKRGVSEKVLPTVGDVTPSPQWVEKMRLTSALISTRRTARIAEATAAAERQVADRAQRVADRTGQAVKDTRAASQAARSKADDAARLAANPPDHLGAESVRELADLKLEQSTAGAHAADMLDMRASEAGELADVLQAETDAAVEVHRALVNSEAREVARVSDELDMLWERASDSMRAIDGEINDAVAKLPVKDDLVGQADATKRLLEHHEGRLPNGWHRTMAEYQAAEARLADLIATSKTLDDFTSVRLRADRVEARMGELAAQNDALVARGREVEAALAAAEAPNRPYYKDYSDKLKYEKLYDEWQDLNASYYLEVEGLGRQREQLMDQLRRTQAELKSARELRAVMQVELNTTAKLWRAESGNQALDVRNWKQQLDGLLGRRDLKVGELKERLAELEREVGSLGLGPQMEHVARMRQQLLDVDDRGYLSFDLVDHEGFVEVGIAPDSTMGDSALVGDRLPERRPDGDEQLFDLLYHGGPDGLNLPAGRAGNAAGPTAETNNFLGIHVAAAKRHAEQFADSANMTASQGGALHGVRVHSKRVASFMDSNDALTGNEDWPILHAPHKGWGASRVDSEMALAAIDDGVVDVRALHDALAPDSGWHGAVDEIADLLDFHAEVHGSLLRTVRGGDEAEIAQEIGRIVNRYEGETAGLAFIDDDLTMGTHGLDPDDFEDAAIIDQGFEAVGLDFLSDMINPTPTKLAVKYGLHKDILRDPKGKSLWDAMVPHADVADGWKARAQAEGYDVVTFHDVGSVPQAIVLDNAQIEHVGGEMLKRADEASLTVDVPTAPRTPKLSVELEPGRTMLDLETAEKALVGQINKRRWQMHQHKIDAKMVDLDVANGKLAEAQQSAAQARSLHSRQLKELASKGKTWTAQKRLQVEESNRLLIEAQDMFAQADAIEAQYVAALQDEAAQAALGAQAARGPAIDAHNANQKALAEVARFEGQAKLAEAKAATWGRNEAKIEAKLAAIDPDDVKLVEQLVWNFKDQTHRLIDFQTIAPNDIADIIMAAEKVSTREGMQGFLRYYDRLTGLFKAWAVATPGFHSRNYMGGLFNNYLAGVDGSNYRKFRQADKAFREAMLKNAGDVESSLRAISDPKVRAAYGVMHDGNILESTGQVGSELSHHLQVGGDASGVGVGPALKRATVSPVHTDARSIPMRTIDRMTSNTVTRANFEGSSFVERQLRGTMALDTLLAGGTADDAVARVYKYHFNYGDLSGFETDVMRRVIPFYTWSRKNLPLQIEGILTNPKAYSRYYQLKNEMEVGQTDGEIVPAYYQSLLPIQITSGETQTYLTPELPMHQLVDAQEAVTAVWNRELPVSSQLLGQVNPLIKVPLERAAGKSFFTGAPYREGLQETPRSWGFLMPFAGAIGKAKRDKSGAWMMADEDLTLLEQYMPLLGRMRRMVPSEEKYQDRMLTTYMSTLFGVGMRTNTLDDQVSEIRRRRRVLDSQNADNRSLGHEGYYEFPLRVDETQDPKVKRR